MGLGQVALARITAVGPDGKLHMEQLPVVGLMRTHCANEIVTDSAAAGTAIASGAKTDNGMVGQTPDGRDVMTILEAAKCKGMLTGLVVTSTISHATPAVFGAHVRLRDMQSEIAEQLVANKVNVMLGGGREYFLPKSDSNSKRADQLNLVKEAKASGYCYIETAKELEEAHGPYLLGLFQYDALTTKPPEPSLAELTEKAIEVLSKKHSGLSEKNSGFFLMVEGSQIDLACHANDANNAVRQTLLFDKAVNVAVDFAMKDKQTLVVVTADHETGGLVTNDGNMDGTHLELSWSTKHHSSLPVPVYAFGPASEMFAGVYDNTEIAKRMAKILGTKQLPVEMGQNVELKNNEPTDLVRDLELVNSK